MAYCCAIQYDLFDKDSITFLLRKLKGTAIFRAKCKYFANPLNDRNFVEILNRGLDSIEFIFLELHAK